MDQPAVALASRARAAPRRLDRGLVAYFAVAYAVSWSWLIPMAVAGGVAIAGRGWPTHFPALLGPLIAAVLVTAGADGRRGLRDLLRRMTLVRVPLRWWVFSLSPLLVLTVVLAIDAATGRPLPSADDFANFGGLPSRWGVFGVVAALLLVNGFGEETGWRGFALPRLQARYSPLAATSILAALWACWHAPMFLVVETFRSFGVGILIGWMIGLFSGAIVLGWLYNRSRGSILLVAIWHASYNLISGTDAAKGLLAAMSTTLVIGLAATLMALEIRAHRRGLPTVLGPPAAGTSRRPVNL